MKIQVTETAKSARERRIKKLKDIDPTKADTAALYELLIQTNERLEELYDMVKQLSPPN